MIKDKYGNELKVGDTVVFSDAGRMGSVHVGIITSKIELSGFKIDFNLVIRDNDTKRLNRRYSKDVLKYTTGGTTDANRL